MEFTDQGLEFHLQKSVIAMAQKWQFVEVQTIAAHGLEVDPTAKRCMGAL